MGIYSIKPLFQKSLKPLFNLCVRNNVHPDVINLLALIMSLFTGVALLYASNYKILFLAVPLLVLLRIAFNALDGLVARAQGVSSKIGEVYNELYDRLSDIVIFVFLAFAEYANAKLVLIALAAVLLNSYLGILGKSAGGSRVYKGFIGKADRMLYLGIVSIISYFTLALIYWEIFIIFILAGTVLSSIQRFFIIRKELN